MRQYDQAVLRLALHLTGSEQDAQDIHQEAFLKAYRYLGNFRFECSFYTWIYRIVTNLCLDQLRRRKARREDPSVMIDASGEELDLLSNVSDERAGANPDRELQRKILGQRITGGARKVDAARAHGLRAEALPGTEAENDRRNAEHYGRDSEEHALSCDQKLRAALRDAR